MREYLLVDSIKQTKRKKPAASFVETDEQDPAWQVTLKYDRMPDTFVELWFDNEAQARQFPMGPISLGQLFGRMGANSKASYTVTGVSLEKRFVGVNQFTDGLKELEMQVITLMSQIMNMAIQLWLSAALANSPAYSWLTPGRTLTGLEAILTAFRIPRWKYPQLGVPGAPLADYYVRIFAPGGWIDADGYHKPGVKERGTGWFIIWGKWKDLEPVDVIIDPDPV